MLKSGIPVWIPRPLRGRGGIDETERDVSRSPVFLEAKFKIAGEMARSRSRLSGAYSASIETGGAPAMETGQYK